MAQRIVTFSFCVNIQYNNCQFFLLLFYFPTTTALRVFRHEQLIRFMNIESIIKENYLSFKFNLQTTRFTKKIFCMPLIRLFLGLFYFFYLFVFFLCDKT